MVKYATSLATGLLTTVGNFGKGAYDFKHWINVQVLGYGDSPTATTPITTTTTGNTTVLKGINSSVTINHANNTVKIPVTTSPTLPTGNIGSTSGQTGMFTTFNMRTSEFLAFESGTLNLGTAQNSLIFDLSVDPTTFKYSNDGLGATTHGQGLLGGGAGYQYFMSSDYVNQSGGEYVSSSNQTTAGFRIGNVSLSEFGRIMNAVKAITANDMVNPNVSAAAMFMNAYNAYNTIAYTDPITLDSGNDGTLFSAQPVNFDYDADGTPESLSWTAPTDPLLVMDINGDGRINNGTELLDLTDSGKPLNLFTLDTNADNKLDANDNTYFDLQIWTDRNQDGYASAGELQTLSDLGITSIDLDPTHIQTKTIAGQNNVQTTIKGVNATYSNGQTRTLWDVPFTPTNPSTNPVTTTAYTASINKISSNGQTALQAVSSSGVAINLNGSGATQAIGSLGNDTLTGTTGADWLIGGTGADQFDAGASNDLIVIDAEDHQADINGGAGIDTVLVADDRSVVLNLAQAQVEVVYGGYGDDVFIGGGALAVNDAWWASAA